ncbi:TRAP-type mannitol/chloroaromatic compound transport system, periplasmic component [Hydrogenophaga sp. T4]|nr:TRAP-type mannitol/chloroaromatic compound transport system, periplasmic component [Hydrogenophaga sp. T4]
MSFLNRRTTLAALGAALTTLMAGSALAQQTVTLRLHQFLPPQAPIPSKALVPWAKKIEAESGGRIKVQLFHAMQMGGTPPQLFDQARDGVADLTWTVLGYTPGRFNKSEVFELPSWAVSPNSPRGPFRSTSRSSRPTSSAASS